MERRTYSIQVNFLLCPGLCPLIFIFSSYFLLFDPFPEFLDALRCQDWEKGRRESSTASGVSMHFIDNPFFLLVFCWLDSQRVSG